MNILDQEPTITMTNDWNISSTGQIDAQELEYLSQLTSEQLCREFIHASFADQAIMILELYAHYELHSALIFAANVAFFEHRNYPEVLGNDYVRGAARLLADVPFTNN